MSGAAVVEYLDIRLLAVYLSLQHSTVWLDVRRPISKAEVMKAVRTGVGEEWMVKGFSVNPRRRHHVMKIAAFVKFGFTQPIEIDFPVGEWPRVWSRWPVDDGNHRLRAAWIRGDETVPAVCGGCVETIKHLRRQPPAPASAQ